MRSIRVGLCAVFVSFLAAPARAQAEDSPPSAAFPDLEAPPPGAPPVAPPAQAAVTPVPERHRDEALGAPPPAPRDARRVAPREYVPLTSDMLPEWSFPARDAVEAPPPKRERTWYGWQTLTVDGLAILMLVAAVTEDGRDTNGASLGLLAAGTGTYLFGGPVVHGANGSLGKGGGSLALRIGAPATGILLGASLGSAGCDGACDLKAGWSMLGLMAGMGAAIAIDASVLARKKPPDEQRVTRGVSLVPTVVATRERALAGVAGVF